MSTAYQGIQRDLIFDIGMSEGNDTDFYLRKGFRVIGVEADPAAIKIDGALGEPTRTGRLKIVHRAAFSHAGQRITFFSNSEAQGHSRVVRDMEEFAAKRGDFVTIETIDWPSLVQEFGTPYYCKVDVENSEALFLSSVSGAEVLPEYFSAEAHTIEPVELLHRIG